MVVGRGLSHGAVGQDGMLRLKDGKFQFTPLDHLLAESFEQCQVQNTGYHVAAHCWALPNGIGEDMSLVPFAMDQDCGPDEVVAFLGGFSARASSAAFSHGTVGSDAFKPLVTVEHVEEKKPGKRGRPKKTAPLQTEADADGDAAATESDDSSSSSSSDSDGYGHWVNPGEDEQQRDEAELGAFVQDLVADGEGMAKRIQEGLENDHTGALSKCARSKDCVSELAKHLRDTNQSAALTTEELEEEAVLLLVKHFQKTGSCDGPGPGSDAVVNAAIDRVDAGGDALVAAANLSADSGDESGSDEAVSEEEDGEDGATAAVPVPSVVSVAPPYLKRWKESFDLTVACLRDRLSRNTEALGKNDEVALVMSTKCATAVAATAQPDDPDGPLFFFVKWTDTARREGRYVRIDQAGSCFHVVYSPASMFGQKVPTESFNGSEFICLLNVCGAASRRATGRARDQLPSSVVRFAQLTGTLVGRIALATWLRLI